MTDEEKTEREKVKAKIAKLLNMTRENGASEAEARLAAERNVELMIRFNIPFADLAMGSTASDAAAEGNRFSVLDLIARHGGVKASRRSRRSREGKRSGSGCDSLYFLDGAFVIPARTISQLIAEGDLEPAGPTQPPMRH